MIEGDDLDEENENLGQEIYGFDEDSVINGGVIGLRMERISEI